MKIGILTYHRPCNFGANLQAYASCCYFKSLGHEVKVIDYVRKIDLKYESKVSKTQFEAHRKFVETRLPLTRQVGDAQGLCDVVAEERFEMLFIGADAVWRSPVDDDCVFFAKWLFEDPRISNVKVCSLSAAHMGKGFRNISAEKRNDIKQCLDRFHHITVRDEWTRQVIIRDIYNGHDRQMDVTPDPVFMLSDFVKDEPWDNRGLESKKYILMTLPRNWLKERKARPFRQLWFWRFKRIVNKAGFQLVELPLPEGKSGMTFDACIDYPIDSLQWFLFIRNAKAFAGLRFHAIVSAISNGTNFYSMDTYGDKSSKSKWLDRLGLHQKARALDIHSKIRNLLKDTPFEEHRTGGRIEWEAPQLVFQKIANTEEAPVTSFKKKQKERFAFNLCNVLNSVNRPQRSILSLTETCTGCFACANACSRDAITLPENHEGFYFPVIDSSRCIDCGLCDKVCPQLGEKPTFTMQRAYYGWSKDDRKRMSSSSGGVFSMLADITLKNGGVVYGAAYNMQEGIRLETMSTEQVSLTKLQKSKYVQNYVGDAYRRVKNDLQAGRQVLYCGTACQIAGLKSYLHKEYDNLTAIDFVCHGVPSMSLLREHLKYRALSDVKDIVFRVKKRQWVDDFKIIYGEDEKVWQRPYQLDEYLNMFMKSINLRRSCYSCKYCNGERASDITLADFYGVKKYKPEIWDKRGLSLLLANTDKGISLIEEIRKSDENEIFDLPLQYAEYVYLRDRHDPSSKYDIKKRNAFITDVYSMGYGPALKKHGYKTSKKQLFKYKKQVCIKRIKGIIKKT